ncbi:MAG: DNA translocase FtsK 4TM domain-containing protein [Bacteroidetes bacterium]|nr:DNA translocase FtsK 4TM domain-containing protein [Bacteroidota bacterium]
MADKKNSRNVRKKKKAEVEAEVEETEIQQPRDFSKWILAAGFLATLFALFSFLSFAGYLFSYQSDFDKVANTGYWQLFGDTNIMLNNWMGKTGAILAHLFIYKSFGIASLVFSMVSFLAGFVLLFKAKFFSWPRVAAMSLFLLFWVPATCGFVLLNKSEFLFIAGKYGFNMAVWLQSAMGSLGTVLFLLFAATAFSSLYFNIKFDLSKKKMQPDETQMMQKEILEQTANAPVLEEERLVNHQVFEPVEFDVTSSPELVENIALKSPILEVADTQELEIIMPPDDIIEETIAVTEEDKTTDVIESTVPLTIENSLLPEEETEMNVQQVLANMGEYDPKLDLSSYQFPDIDLLENYVSNKSKLSPEELKAELESNKNKIVETLGHYNIGIEKIKATVGPTVTLFEIVPQAGVRISKIKNLEDDIALSLAALGIRIIAPIPGKGTIGIEVPNQTADVVSMRSVVASEKFQNSDYDLPIVLGKTISNEVFVTDLAKMPHLLMAGATGQGKSVGLNAILVSLLYKKHPAQVKFVLVDPKKVELTLFKKIERHFLAKLPGEEEAIITDTKKVVNTLNSLCIEMDNRYELLKDAQVRNLKEYNAKFIQRRLNPENGHRFLPYIVLVVDEFADLIMTAGREVEMPIARLAQLARAIGIHLIIATQRPSVNIITGTIKANFPARIAFRVTSKIDSRTILDAGGADQLIGRGDMLLSTGADLLRIQCAFVDTPEVEKITDFIGAQRGYPEAFMLPEYVGPEGESGSVADFSAADRDPLFEEAARIIVQNQQGSASLLQRKLKLGYNRAGRLVDQLEASGIIGPFEGSKAREVKIKTEAELMEFLGKV